GLSVQRMKLDVISENLANVETTRTEEGTPYARKTVNIEAREIRPVSSFSEMYGGILDRFNEGEKAGGSMVPVAEIVEDRETPFTLKYDPGHPDADANGMVKMPNVNVIDEMVRMVTATRAYEANVTAIESAKSMFMRALEI
ncbi:MAG: flagellar basal body rod protein FlgC, partial [Candidatus Latescibacteria bacterium]|nr:flagellar basal body rod protein FlgC [bacterium]MBD3424482.1 flagellar basal body rod protein FlgC [Candidatus Latescibacterota bacterium]